MITVALMVMMQLTPTTSFIVSTRAGLVNYVQGSATVKAATSIPAGQPVGTGPGGAVEILLNPGSYLRMGENSQVILDNVDLSAIALRIMQGSAVIEANEIDKESPIKIGIGNLKVEIVKDGIYLFTDGKVVVVDGKVRDASNGLFYGKGYQIADDDHGYRAQKVKTFTTALELWSQKRDELIAQANLNVSNSLRRTPNLPLNSFLDVWLWYPAYGAFIYMPGARYRSPYGYLYRSVGEFFGGSGVASSGSNSGGFGNSGRSSGGFTDSGGGGSGGFSSAAPSGGGASSAAPSAGAQGGSSSGHTATQGR